MNLTIRPICGPDYPQVLTIVNTIEAPWASTLEELRQEDESLLMAGGVCLHYVACSLSEGAIVGHAVLRGPIPSDAPQSYSVEIRVDPKMQRRGIGSALWRRISQDVAHLSSTLTAWVREGYPDAIRFAQNAGFQKRLSSSPWLLNVSDAQDRDLRPVLDKVDALGVRITTLARERQKDRECLARLHCLRTQFDRDIPGMGTSPPVSYETFVREVEAPGSLADAFFIACKGSEYLGMSCLVLHSTDPRALNQTTTGVRSDHRALGIATALKWHDIDYARAHGYDSIHTYMDGTNAPMIRLNEKLGFRPGVGVALMVRAARP